jgi:hypothetical protein
MGTENRHAGSWIVGIREERVYIVGNEMGWRNETPNMLMLCCSVPGSSTSSTSQHP